MRQDITEQYAIQSQKDASWAYNNAMEKFYYSMLEVVFLRIKSHLNSEGLKKVIEMDTRRNNNENLGVEFSQKTWEILAESWIGAEGRAMSKIIELYGLEISDMDINKIKNYEKNTITPTCDSNS